MWLQHLRHLTLTNQQRHDIATHAKCHMGLAHTRLGSVRQSVVHQAVSRDVGVGMGQVTQTTHSELISLDLDRLSLGGVRDVIGHAESDSAGLQARDSRNRCCLSGSTIRDTVGFDSRASAFWPPARASGPARRDPSPV